MTQIYPPPPNYYDGNSTIPQYINYHSGNRIIKKLNCYSRGRTWISATIVTEMKSIFLAAIHVVIAIVVSRTKKRRLKVRTDAKVCFEGQCPFVTVVQQF